MTIELEISDVPPIVGDPDELTKVIQNLIVSCYGIIKLEALKILILMQSNLHFMH